MSKPVVSTNDPMQYESLPPAPPARAPSSLEVRLYSDVLPTAFAHLSLQGRAVALPTCGQFLDDRKETTREEIRQTQSMTWEKLKAYAVALNDNNHELEDRIYAPNGGWTIDPRQPFNERANQIGGVGRCWGALRELNLRHVSPHDGFSAADLKQIPPSKRALITALRFSGGFIKKDVIELLQLFPNAVLLDFEYLDVDDEIVSHLPYRLVRLMVMGGDDKLTDAGRKMLAGKCQMLTHLSVRKFSQQGLSLLARSGCSLTHLCLIECQCPEGVLTEFLNRSPHLTHLIYSGGEGITNNMVASLAAKCRELETLRISDSQNLDDLNCLTGCERLQTFSIRNCPKIADVGLASFIKHGKNLRYFSVYAHTSISARTIENLANYSQKLSSLVIGANIYGGREAIDSLATSGKPLFHIMYFGRVITSEFPHLIPKNAEERAAELDVPYWND